MYPLGGTGSSEGIAVSTAERKAVLGLIIARGGSKGLPGKNVRFLGGKPLIAWTVQAAKASRHLTRLVLSTDDETIAAVARSHGCDTPFMRPPELAKDDASAASVVRHALETLGERFDYIVLLQPTSPFRTAHDIDACIEMCMQAGVSSCVSVAPAPKPVEWYYRLDGGDRLAPIFPGDYANQRRQEIRESWCLNGAVYVVGVDAFLQTGQFVAPDTVGYKMPAERSVDIDTMLDLGYAQMLLDTIEL